MIRDIIEIFNKKAANGMTHLHENDVGTKVLDTKGL